ncbi:MAG: hypothetical protein ACK57B_09760 [Betaproteobacteria bacterium]
MTTPSVKTLVAADAASTGPTNLTRIRGVMLMVLGPLLAFGMLLSLIAIGPSLLGAEGAALSAGTPEQNIAGFVLMTWVGLLGAVFTFGGWNLWRHGRLGRRIAWPSAVLVVGLLGAMPWLRALFP